MGMESNDAAKNDDDSRGLQHDAAKTDDGSRGLQHDLQQEQLENDGLQHEHNQNHIHPLADSSSSNRKSKTRSPNLFKTSKC